MDTSLLRGVHTKLLASFGTIAVLAVVTAVAGSASHLYLRESQRQLIKEALPRARVAEQVSTSARDIVTDVTRISESTTVKSVDILLARFGEDSRRLQERVMQSGAGSLATVDRDQILNLLDHIVENATGIAADRRDQLERARAVRLRTGDAVEVATRFAERVTPHLVEAEGRFSESLESDPSLAADAHAQTIRLASLRFLCTDLAARLAPVPIMDKRERLASLRQEASSFVRDLSRLVSEIPLDSLREELAGSALKLMALTTEEGGILDERILILEDADAIAETETETRQLEEQLQDWAREIVESSRKQMLRSTIETGRRTDLALSVLLIVPVVTILISALIYYFYVRRRVSGRLNALSAKMRELSGGSLGQEVTRTGEDEIGEMEKALEGFRRNAVELDEKERSLRAATAELKRSNAELDSFAYVASHDLKSPLRAIDNLAQWIQEDCGSLLPDASGEHLERLRARIRRMEGLLNGLLEYSRVDSAATAPRSIESAELLEEVLQSLNVPPGVEIVPKLSVSELTIDVTALQLVLRNLVDNAIKHNDNPTGRVEVHMDRDGDQLNLVVEDNGPGIDHRYHDEVFRAFRKLRSRDEVEGSGVGLSIVKKTVELQGGSIQVKDAPGSGARFEVRWPLARTSTKSVLSSTGA